ncbi:MAG: hypothetical protein ACYS30_21140 [Planctomycetota bacterium]|jgi:hypothetical protein
MAKLSLGFYKRNKTSGRMTRLSGTFSSSVPRKHYSEVFITDCKKTVKLNGRIYPRAKQAFSFTEPDFANANSQLNLTGDLYVYVRAKGSKDDYSNVHSIDKSGTRKNQGSLKKLKEKKLKAVKDRLAEIGKEISKLNSEANKLKKGFLAKVLPGSWLAELDNEITDKMAELALERERLEKELKARQRIIEKLFDK